VHTGSFRHLITSRKKLQTGIGAADRWTLFSTSYNETLKETYFVSKLAGWIENVDSRKDPVKHRLLAAEGWVGGGGHVGNKKMTCVTACEA